MGGSAQNRPLPCTRRAELLPRESNGYQTEISRHGQWRPNGISGKDGRQRRPAIGGQNDEGGNKVSDGDEQDERTARDERGRFHAHGGVLHLAMSKKGDGALMPRLAGIGMQSLVQRWGAARRLRASTSNTSMAAMTGE